MVHAVTWLWCSESSWVDRSDLRLLLRMGHDPYFKCRHQAEAGTRQSIPGSESRGEMPSDGGQVLSWGEGVDRAEEGGTGGPHN